MRPIFLSNGEGEKKARPKGEHLLLSLKPCLKGDDGELFYLTVAIRNEPWKKGEEAEEALSMSSGNSLYITLWRTKSKLQGLGEEIDEGGDFGLNFGGKGRSLAQQKHRHAKR